MDEGCPLTEKEQRHLDDGIAEFNSGRYWHAHGIQGLIQVTALMFQYERQNPRGINNMWGKLTDKLGTPELPFFVSIWSVDIPKLLDEVIPFLNDSNLENPCWDLNPNDVQI